MTDKEINEAVARKLGVDPEFGCSCFSRPACGHEKKDYCNSITAAWEIVETLNYCYLFYSKDILQGWECKLIKEDIREFYGISSTAPMAICLAFLKLP